MVTMTIQEAATLADLAKLLLPMKDLLTEDNIASKIKGVEGAQDIINQKVDALKTINEANNAKGELTKLSLEIEARDKASSELQALTNEKATQLIADRNKHEENKKALEQTLREASASKEAADEAKKVYDDKSVVLDKEIEKQTSLNSSLETEIANYKDKAKSLADHISLLVK